MLLSFDDNNNMFMYSSTSNRIFTLTELERYQTVLPCESNADSDNSTQSNVNANLKIDAKKIEDRRGVENKDENENEENRVTYVCYVHVATHAS